MIRGTDPGHRGAPRALILPARPPAAHFMAALMPTSARPPASWRPSAALIVVIQLPPHGDLTSATSRRLRMAPAHRKDETSSDTPSPHVATAETSQPGPHIDQPIDRPAQPRVNMEAAGSPRAPAVTAAAAPL